MHSHFSLMRRRPQTLQMTAIGRQKPAEPKLIDFSDVMIIG